MSETAIQLSIPATEITDVERFESLRAQAYRNRDHSALTALAENTTLADGGNLFDEFGSILDADDPSVQALQESEVRAKSVADAITGTVFYDMVLGLDAEVKDIVRHVKLPEDTDRTEAQRRMAARIPSGRKQNRSSFRHRQHVAPRR